jgi:sulfate permease, SulP family
MANIATSFPSGYPVTGGFARSEVNCDAGAETPIASVFDEFISLLSRP